MTSLFRDQSKLKKICYCAVAAIAVFNIIFWIYALWFDETILASVYYGKLLLTSFALVILFLVLAGLIGLIFEMKLKKNHYIN